MNLETLERVSVHVDIFTTENLEKCFTLKKSLSQNCLPDGGVPAAAGKAHSLPGDKGPGPVILGDDGVETL